MTKAAFAEVVDTPTPAPIRKPILNASRFGAPGQFRSDWLASVPPDTPWEAIHSPSFWRTTVHRIRIGDMIEVRSDDLTKWGLFLVNFVEVSTAAISLVPIIEKDLPPAVFTGDATGAYFPRYAGVIDGWAVIRAEDGHVMEKSLRSQQEARALIARDFSKPTMATFG
jgi:hypothetical protein